ncbi:MAG: EscU/YscU/HrcU family type III secretion system export apparatus switch protein, partial [Burkholderiales bacterium]|nr:EscU/YscU/HrcU family type III secretion system export apparatus switch protein [Burkholderiales bacterium]
MADQDVSREDKQLPASERRLQKAREDGQVARSRDLGHFVILGSALLAAIAFGPALGRAAIGLIRKGLSFGRVEALAPERLPAMLGALSADALIATLPLVGGLALAAIAGTIVPGGVVLTTKPLSMDLGKLSPMKGIGRIFSVRGAVELGKLIVIAIALASIGTWFVLTSLPEFASLATRPLPQGLDSSAGLLGAGLAALLGVLMAVTL